MRSYLIISALGCLLLAATSGLKPFTYPLPAHFPAPYPDPISNRTTLEGADLGRHLFYDPVLSVDSTFSCASCHKQSQAFSGSPEIFNSGQKGQKQKRNTPPLFNLIWSREYFWDGRAASLEQQAMFPVREHTELNLSWQEAAKRIARRPYYRKKFTEVFPGQPLDSVTITKAIAQFERTLLSLNSRYDQAVQQKTKLTQNELEGFELVSDMTKGNCMHCHTADSDGRGTTYQYANNGLDVGTFADSGRAAFTGNLNDLGKFKIPSLRNLAYTSPYMHDGRIKTLEEVVDFYADGIHPGPYTDSRLGVGSSSHPKLTKAERIKIVAFLNTLNDPSFVKDKRFSNPWN